jgi:hypothetical protein
VQSSTEVDLDELVQIRPWRRAAFEFAHFGDDELAKALVTIHPDRRGLTVEELAVEMTQLGPIYRVTVPPAQVSLIA